MTADQALNRRTKIVATLGPASRSESGIRALIKAGANVFRLNFSHGSSEEHLETLQRIRAASLELGIPVGVLQDLAGPKIRISNVEGDYVTIEDQNEIELAFADSKSSRDSTLSNARRIYVETVNPLQVLKPGHQVLLADGIIELKAAQVGSDCVVCSIIKGGRMRSRVGIAFPDSVVDLPATTQKDLKDVEWAIANKIDYVAVSFVKNARDLSMLREISSKHGGDIRLIAKIERRTALENIEEILDASDGLMVARGDLGLELPLEKVPLVQKQLIAQANYRGIPVIVATQMLHSMITSTRPTRAEVTDIAFAVMSGADAVMLSEETAIGEHPRKAVEYLGKIAAEADRSFVFDEYKLRLRDADRLTVPDAVAYAACAASIKVSATAIIACTETGTSARLVAKYRPQEPLYGVSTSEAALRRMSLYWGVKPLRIGEPQSHQDELEIALESVKKDGNFPKGSRAVVTGGLSVRSPGATTMLEIKEL